MNIVKEFQKLKFYELTKTRVFSKILKELLTDNFRHI